MDRHPWAAGEVAAALVDWVAMWVELDLVQPSDAVASEASSVSGA